MFRSSATATRTTIRAFTQVQSARSSYNAASKIFNNASLSQTINQKRPQVLRSLARPTITSLLYATKSDPKKAEVKLQQNPDAVTATSSVRPILDKGTGEHEEDMMVGIKQDIHTIADTFALKSVPKESFLLGAAGVLPYAATALSSTYLAFDVNHAAQHGVGFFFAPETAMQLLEFITPLQIGYGAVIISFLGAIHWGLEYAGYGGHQSYRRYMYGVIAPAVAWPTIFMPVDIALITQFLSFVFLYFADARATVKGWFPPWYSTYRFVLTFIVGASIVVTLIGRGQVATHDVAVLKSPIEAIKRDKDLQWEELQKEEQEKQKRMAKEEAEAASEDKEEEAPKESKKEEATKGNKK